MTRASAKWRRRLSLVTLVAGLALLTGCVGMPAEGPVTESRAEPQAEEATGVFFDPRPPRTGESPGEIVSGFLEAMKATPVRTSVARQFLSADARRAWAPERQVLTYGDITPPDGGTVMSVELSDVDAYDERGAWVRATPTRSLRFSVVEEDGEWRLSTVPDALIVPDDWFDDWYQRLSTYYFDPRAEILVPEPVFVPRGDQMASFLVRSLLAPPRHVSSGVVRTFFQPGMSDGLSVPVSQAGVAEVSLSGDPALVEAAGLDRMLAQLVWTLRQVPQVRAVELRVGGEPLGEPGGGTQLNLDVGSTWSPTGVLSSTHLFGLLDGQLVSGELSDLEATSGPLGRAPTGADAISVDLTGTRVAAVGNGGTTLSIAAVEDADGEGALRQLLSGGDRLQVAGWDYRGRAWVLDRNGGRARVLLLAGQRVREVRMDGVTGEDVDHLLVSRDATRLVAVVAQEQMDRLVVARVRQREDGVPRGSVGVRILPLAVEGRGGVRDLAWRSPTTVSVLSAITDDLAQVRTLSVEASAHEVHTGGVTRLRGRPQRLVGSPVEGLPVYAVQGRAATDLTRPDRPVVRLPRGLTHLTWVG